jgi:hypothetical protein
MSKTPLPPTFILRLRRARAEDAQISRRQRARGWWRGCAAFASWIDYASESPYLIARTKSSRTWPTTPGVDRSDPQRRARIPGDHQTFPHPGRAGQSRRPEHRRAGQAGRPHRRQFESQSGGAPALAGMPMVKDRLTRLLPLLSRELEVLKLGSKIQNEVVTSMSKNQRDFFLREQIRAIQRELGEVDSGAAEAKDLRDQIEQNNLPEEPKKVALKELERLQQMPPAVAEYTMTRNYLDWLINLPWSKFTEDKLDLAGRQPFAGRTTFRVAQSQGPLAGIFGRHQTQAAAQRPHPLPGRPAGRGQDFPRQKRGRGAGPQICPHFPGRHARRGRNSRPSPHLRRRLARTHHSKLAPRRIQQPGHSAGRIGQGRLGFSRRPGLGAAGGAGPRRKTTPSWTITWTCPTICRASLF